MVYVFKLVFIVTLCLTAAVLTKGSSDEDSDESWTPPYYFEYKVEALNTALYYILHALQDDLRAGYEIDISFLIRIKVIAGKIKSFHGDIDETNALMLGEILRTLPQYLENKIEQEGLSFDEYTMTPTDATLGSTSEYAEDQDSDSETGRTDAPEN